MDSDDEEDDPKPEKLPIYRLEVLIWTGKNDEVQGAGCRVLGAWCWVPGESYYFQNFLPLQGESRFSGKGVLVLTLYHY